MTGGRGAGAVVGRAEGGTLRDRAGDVGAGVLRRVGAAVALPAVLLTVWWFASAGSESFYFPPLSAIVDVFGPTWFEGRLVTDAAPSLARLLAGYAAALVVGIAGGVAIGSSPVLRALTEPVLEFFRAIPPPVMIPVVMLFLGIFTPMKVFVIAAGALWPILLNTAEGVRGVDEVLRDTAAVYRLRRRTALRTLVLRAASPQIMTGARQGLSLAIILMVISEMFAASNGLGFTVVQFQRSFAVPEMWTGIIVLGVLGVLLSALLRLVERRVLAWHRGVRRTARESR